MNAAVVLGLVVELEVEVHEAALDVLEALHGHLQRLADAVGLAQGHVGVEHDVQLHQKPAAKVPRPDRVHVPHALVGLYRRALFKFVMATWRQIINQWLL